MLWHKAVPAKQRIKEIEQGLKGEFIETIKDPYGTQIFSNILKSANEEILITLPLPFLFQIVLQEYPNIFLAIITRQWFIVLLFNKLFMLSFIRPMIFCRNNKVKCIPKLRNLLIMTMRRLIQ